MARSGRMAGFELALDGPSTAAKDLLYSSQPWKECVMSIRVTNSKVGPDIVLLHLAGHVAISEETDALEWLLRSLLHQGENKLILDLAGVDQIDADAALFLVRCFFTVRGSGG
jgi:hypothetical protein